LWAITKNFSLFIVNCSWYNRARKYPSVWQQEFN
jgi:hypothetical protein